MQDTLTTSSSTPDSVYLDTPEELSEADRLELAALSGAGVGEVSAPVGRSATFPDGIRMPTVPNYPEGYKEPTRTPDPTFFERINREGVLADSNGARQALEDAVVKPGMRLTSKRAVTLPAWASPSWVRASHVADAAEEAAAELEAEKAELPRLLNRAIYNQDVPEIQAVQERMARIDAELFGARLLSQKAQAQYYTVGAAEYAANEEQANALLPDKKAAADLAAQELKDVANERDECRIKAYDWRGYAKRSETGIAEITAAERRRLVSAAVRGPRQYR